MLELDTRLLLDCLAFIAAHLVDSRVFIAGPLGPAGGREP